MKTRRSSLLLGMLLATGTTVFLSSTVVADEDPTTFQQTLEAYAVAPSEAQATPAILETPAQLAAPPALSATQIQQLNAQMERVHGSGPIVGGVAAAAAAPGTQTTGAKPATGAAFEPQTPETVWTLRNTAFQATVPAGNRSNVMENSVGALGKYVFQTGNWFAARSVDGGLTFSYVNPFSGWTAPSAFCCDQLSLADESRNIIIWLRQGIAYTNPSNGNYENEFKLGISSNGGASFLTYSFKPTGTNSTWTNQWWDYPEMQVAGKYLYITYNMFNKAGSWTRSVVLRFPLDSLRTGVGFGYNYYQNSGWFTFEPVAGADHTMYWASNWPTTAPQNSRVAIWKWDEVTNTISSVVRTVAAWDLTGRNTAVCGAAAGNWTARLDQRITAGARYSIHGSNLQYPGRKVLGWWWTAKQGTGFPFPRIEGVAFYEDNLTQVPGNQGRPFVWNSSNCFAYPAAASNVRSDVALVFNYSSGAASGHLPYVGYAMADEYAGAPAGWTYYGVRASTSRPADNKWGDYNTVRRFAPVGEVWAAASHYLTGGTTSPVYFVFGRERDRWGYDYWYNK